MNWNVWELDPSLGFPQLQIYPKQDTKNKKLNNKNNSFMENKIEWYTQTKFIDLRVI